MIGESRPCILDAFQLDLDVLAAADLLDRNVVRPQLVNLYLSLKKIGDGN
jgi:hypothetical protein